MKFQLESSKPRIFSSTSSPCTAWKFSFLVLSELAVNITCPSITATEVFPRRILLLALTIAPEPIAVALFRFPTDTLAERERTESDGGVAAARGVASERIDSVGGVGDARGVASERKGPVGGVVVANGVAKECIDSTGGVGVARGVAKERIESGGGVESARGVVTEHSCPQTGVALRPSNPRQREPENDCCNQDGEKRSLVRMAKHI
jgi:hypothetical protein